MLAASVDERSRGLVAIALLGPTLLWATTLVAAPYVVTHRVPIRLSYLVATVAYIAGGFVCHQRPERSFHVWSVQLPVCARCTAIYLAAPLGVALGLSRRRWTARGKVRDPRRTIREPVSGEIDVRWWRAMLSLAAVPTAATVIMEWTGVAEPSNAARAAAGAPLGLAVGWLAALTLGSVDLSIVAPWRSKTEKSTPDTV